MRLRVPRRRGRSRPRLGAGPPPRRADAPTTNASATPALAWGGDTTNGETPARLSPTGHRARTRERPSPYEPSRLRTRSPRNSQRKPDVFFGQESYCRSTTPMDGGARMVGEDGSVTIEVAAELMSIEVRAIREWSADRLAADRSPRRRRGRAPRPGAGAGSIADGAGWRGGNAPGGCAA